jgi:hypothetical protein
MKRLIGAILIPMLCLLTVAAGCASTCDNAGVTVDGQGNIVVRAESGFISPNSSILRNVSEWPQPPPEEEKLFVFAATR